MCLYYIFSSTNIYFFQGKYYISKRKYLHAIIPLCRDIKMIIKKRFVPMDLNDVKK